jgi:Ca2+-binding RTX toxin-like protein
MPVYPPSATAGQIADQLTREGPHWNKAVITYAFNNSSTAGNALDATFQSWVAQAVQTVEEMVGLDFQLVTGAADITFNGSRGNGTYASSRWSLPREELISGNIYFDQAWPTNQSSSLNFGSYGLMTILHEFLHALGLSHPGTYNGSGSYFSDAPFLQDTHRYTVMSYFDADSDGSATSHWLKVGASWQWQYPQTPMIYDLLALTDGNYGGSFSGYNLNTSTRAGDTVYGYNATTDINSVFNFLTNDGPVLAIYDAGGMDTLDLSGDGVTTRRIVSYDAAGNAYTSDASRTESVIDLRPGNYSSTHGMLNNIGIAFGTSIENAIGTNFNDTIIGNDTSNVLFGGAGADGLQGGSGNDFLAGGSGADVLAGGAGTDWFAFAGGSADGDTIADYSPSDYVYFGGSTGAASFTASGANVIANGVTLLSASAGDVAVITQASTSLLGTSNLALQSAVLNGGLASIAGYGGFDVSVFDGNSNDVWQTIVSTYTALGALDYSYTSYDAGQAYAALLTDYDQNASQYWSTVETYYSTPGVVDTYSLAYDPSYTYSRVTVDLDQTSANPWSSVYTYYSQGNVDLSMYYYDSGQPYSIISIDFDQNNTTNWSSVYGFYNSSSVISSYLYIYDEGQTHSRVYMDYDEYGTENWQHVDYFYLQNGALDLVSIAYDSSYFYSRVVVDYDQDNSFGWSSDYNHYDQNGKRDYSLTYFDEGQPLSTIWVDYDQDNQFWWDQHVIANGPAGTVVSDYYI